MKCKRTFQTTFQVNFQSNSLFNPRPLDNKLCLDPIQADVQFTQDSLFPYCDTNILHLQISNIYCIIKLLSKKCPTKSARNMINHKFLKTPYQGKFKCAKYLQNFHKLNLYLKKTENIQILFTGITCKYLFKIYFKNCAICFKAFQRVIKI